VAIRDKMRANAGSLLSPGEVVQAVISAKAPDDSLVWVLSSSLGRGAQNRVIIVTDKRIVVCSSGLYRSARIKEVLREVPRGTKIGPAEGTAKVFPRAYRTRSLGEWLYIYPRFWPDVATADAAIDGSAPGG